MKQYSLSLISIFITFVLIVGKLTPGWASEKKPVKHFTTDDICPSVLLPTSEQKERYTEPQKVIEGSVSSQVVKDDSASSVFIGFAKDYLGEDTESFMGPDWQENIIRHTQSWKKQDTIDFLILLVKKIGINETLNAIKNTSSLRWIRYDPFRDKMNFLEQYLGVHRYTNMLKKTPLKSFAPNNVKGIRDNIKKIEDIIGREQTVQLVENDFSAFTFINTEIDSIEQYLREDRNIPIEIVHEMIIKNIRAFMNASLHYIQARVSYLERISGILKEDVNQMMIGHFLALTENYFKYNRLPLHISVYVGDVNLADSLIRNKTNDVNATDIEGWTPLHVAAYVGDKNLASLLINHRADINKVDRMGLTPLHVATYTQNIDLVSLLIENGVDVNIPDKNGWTPLFLAVYKNNSDIVSLLLEADSDVTYRDKDGLTAFHVVLEENEALISSLIEYEVDINALDKLGDTVLHSALYRGDITLASLLIENGADVNISNNEGLLPLHIAAYIGDADLILLMIKHGAFDSQAFQTMKSPAQGSLLYWALYGYNPIGIASLLIEYKNEIITRREEMTEADKNAWMSWLHWFLSGEHAIATAGRYTQEQDEEYQNKQFKMINALDKTFDREIKEGTFFYRFLNEVLYREHIKDEKTQKIITFLEKMSDPDKNPIDEGRTPSYWSSYSVAEEIISFLRENYSRSGVDVELTHTE